MEWITIKNVRPRKPKNKVQGLSILVSIVLAYFGIHEAILKSFNVVRAHKVRIF